MGRGPDAMQDKEKVRDMKKKRYWLTPPVLYKRLDDEFHFDYDPCPHPRPDGYDGLEAVWGQSNYVNPPFGRGNIKWVRKAVQERAKGKTVVYLDVLPVGIYEILATSHRLIPLGRVRWVSIETGEQQKHGSYNIMAYVLEPP